MYKEDLLNLPVNTVLRHVYRGKCTITKWSKALEETNPDDTSFCVYVHESDEEAEVSCHLLEEWEEDENDREA